MDFLFTLKDFADEIHSSSVYIAKRSQPKGDTHPPPAEKQEEPLVKTAVTDSSSQTHVDFKVKHPSITLLAKTGSGNEDALLIKVICQMSYAIYGMYSVYTEVCILLLPFPVVFSSQFHFLLLNSQYSFCTFVLCPFPFYCLILFYSIHFWSFGSLLIG